MALIRRALDLGIAAPLLVLAAPVIALVALAVWCEDGGSPLFRAQRVARGGGDFTMFKLRTMVRDAERRGGSSTAADDSRITETGRWLRGTKLDELPQLWNVLRGDMAIVGPRPNVRSGVVSYAPAEMRLLTVRPGITDLASIVFSDEGAVLAGHTDADAAYDRLIRPWKNRLALLGIDHAGALSDLALILLTAGALVARPLALHAVQWLVRRWGGDAALCQVCARRDPLPVMASLI